MAEVAEPPEELQDVSREAAARESLANLALEVGLLCIWPCWFGASGDVRLQWMLSLPMGAGVNIGQWKASLPMHRQCC